MTKLLQIFVVLVLSYVASARYSEYKHTQVCENLTAKLTCNRGKSIKVLYAKYGRTDNEVCANSEEIKEITDKNTELNCRSTNATIIFKRECNGKTSCNIAIKSSVFGDPCPELSKYAEIKYKCSKRFERTKGRSRKDRKKCSPKEDDEIEEITDEDWEQENEDNAHPEAQK